MTTVTFRKITYIYLVINFFFLISILFARANNEIDISAQEILLDKDNDIINATGDVLIKNKQFSVSSEEVIFYNEKKNNWSRQECHSKW